MKMWFSSAQKQFFVFVLIACISLSWGQSNRDQNQEVLYDAPSSMCHAAGRVFPCMPPFTNIAEGVKVDATSTCGTPAKKICRDWLDNEGRPQKSCDVCDARKSRYQHPASLLTDRHIANNQTCWISGPVPPNQDSVVNLTLSLHKRFEVYYISLQPCGTIPDSIAIYKSSDFGKSWRPWQYFSTDCYRAFGLTTSNEHSSQITTANLQQVLCLELKPLRKSMGGHADSVIAFSTSIGRPSTQPWSPALIDWMTMTDLRISLMRFSNTGSSNTKTSRRGRQFTNPNLRHFYADYPIPGMPALYDEPARGINPGGEGQETLHYAFSDLAVGGRCKCNGHANRCIKENGRIRCDCQHNTEGVDCERCKPSYFDRPWARATIKSPNVCKKCDCNLHTNRCKFSKELYLMSDRSSGGVCEKCKHNTAGRRCHYCQDGYYRDWTKPSSHEHVCIKCRCHPIGSADVSSCDKSNGQCICKEGVTGITCDRCKAGYKQTRTPFRPCARSKGEIMKDKSNPDQLLGTTNFADSSQNMPSDPACKTCSARKKRIRFKKFCRKQAVFQATMISRENIGDYARFEMKINQMFRRDRKSIHLLPNRATDVNFPLWVHLKDLHCSCPWLQLGTTFLIISNVKTYKYRNQEEFMLTRKSIALPWQESWKRRLAKFKRREKRGKCQKFSRRAKILKPNQQRGRKNSRPFQPPISSYMNPAYREPYRPYGMYQQPSYDSNRGYNPDYSSNYKPNYNSRYNPTYNPGSYDKAKKV